MERTKDGSSHSKAGARRWLAAAIVGLVAALVPSGLRAQSLLWSDWVGYYKPTDAGLRGITKVRLAVHVQTLETNLPKDYAEYQLRSDVEDLARKHLAKTGVTVVEDAQQAQAIVVVRVYHAGNLTLEEPRRPIYSVQVVVARRLEAKEGPVNALVYEGPADFVKVETAEWKRVARRNSAKREGTDMFLFALNHGLEAFAQVWEESNRPGPGKAVPPGGGASPKANPARDGSAPH